MTAPLTPKQAGRIADAIRRDKTLLDACYSQAEIDALDAIADGRHSVAERRDDGARLDWLLENLSRVDWQNDRLVSTLYCEREFENKLEKSDNPGGHDHYYITREFIDAHLGAALSTAPAVQDAAELIGPTPGYDAPPGAVQDADARALAVAAKDDDEGFLRQMKSSLAVQDAQPVAELIDIDDGIGTTILHWLVDRNVFPVGTKFYAAPQQESSHGG